MVSQAVACPPLHQNAGGGALHSTAGWARALAAELPCVMLPAAGRKWRMVHSGPAPASGPVVLQLLAVRGQAVRREAGWAAPCRALAQEAADSRARSEGQRSCSSPEGCRTAACLAAGTAAQAGSGSSSMCSASGCCCSCQHSG